MQHISAAKVLRQEQSEAGWENSFLILFIYSLGVPIFESPCTGFYVVDHWQQYKVSDREYKGYTLLWLLFLGIYWPLRHTNQVTMEISIFKNSRLFQEQNYS